jgi:hypothetical protein
MSLESEQQTQEYDNSKLNNIDENQETQNLDISESLNFLNYLDDLFNSNLSNNNDENKSDEESEINIENSVNGNMNENEDNNENSDENEVIDNKRKRKDICPGCEPIFQPNQLAHIGPNGCLGDY